ncbi:MAG TPA: zinc ribbon domain-containing protein [Blastocatellia bacterium]|nr:zinc ribbon domain-containing protein [Blastocatellia bacterium]
MNCPLCGAANTAGLRYCTRCGGSLMQAAAGADFERVRQTEHGWDIEKSESPGMSGKRLAGIFWAIAVFGLVSFAVLFGIAVPLSIFHAPRELVVPLYMFGPAAVVLIAGMLIRQVSRLIKIMENDSSSRRQMQRTPSPAPPQIVAPPPGFRSVTEHTTRNFEAAYRDAGEPQR